jgi:hypothetical protein
MHTYVKVMQIVVPLLGDGSGKVAKFLIVVRLH